MPSTARAKAAAAPIPPPQARVIPIRRSKPKTLTPEIVRDVMRQMLAASANEGVPLTWMFTELRHLGYRIHATFSLGALIKRGAGFMLVEDVAYLIDTPTNPPRREPRRRKE